MKDFPIKSGQILLRYIRETDTDFLFSYRSLPEVAKYQYWEPFTMEQTISFVDKCKDPQIKDGQWLGLIIEKEGIAIGDCALMIDHKTAEIGCNISPEFQKQGLAKEVLSALIDYCFQSKHVNEITAITDSRNIASINLLKSLGMMKIPDFENHIICKGEDCIEHKYSLKRK